MASQAEVNKLLEEHEIRLGMPKGLMRSIWQQETSGREKWLKNPELYHYPKGKDGIRRTKGGTISTAFGPFGILDSTAKKPGYGVKPLQNKTLEEQIRFSADYAAARAKHAGSKDNPDWFKGVARYGEGENYAKAVFDRLDTPSTVPSNPLPNLWEDPTLNRENIAATTMNKMAIENQYQNPFESMERYAQEQPQPLPILDQNAQAYAAQMAQNAPQANNSWLSFLSTLMPGQASVQAQPSISAQELDFLAQQILEGNY